jgi:predicted nucleic acid-binding Zn ribbon protein
MISLLQPRGDRPRSPVSHPSAKTGARSFMQSIHTLMQTLERSPQWQANASLRRVLATWPQLVGEAVAQHSRPTKIHRQALQVSVSSAAWSQTLTFERSRILQKLHVALPETQQTIQDLRFATADWHRLTQRSQPTERPTLAEHPSWAESPHVRAKVGPLNAQEAFQRWADCKRTQLASQGHCPHCGSPCPASEVSRWGKCAVCIAHQWYRPLTQNRHS